jgi:hypothetical protein
MKEIGVSHLLDYIENSFLNRPVLEQLQKIIAEKQSHAGTRLEEVFTREFLCGSLARYFYVDYRSSLNLTDSEIASGLGTEGYKNAEGFGFTPARKERHLFTKADIIKQQIPRSWIAGDGKAYRNQACPDFAIRDPLPISIVGEVKFFRSGTPETAVKELYNAARQAVFYLGAFRGEYKQAVVVVADASEGHVFIEGVCRMNPGILERFGEETSIFLSMIRLS